MVFDECPMPQLDFDVVTLSHGSGGKLTHKLLDQCVFEILQNEYLDDQDDGAILKINSSIAVTTDSFVVTPIFFPGGNIGDLAVHGTVNDVAMCGAIPRYLSLGLILEEGLKIEELWKVLVSVRNAARASGVQIVTGDTKVVERGKGDKIFINTTGFGSVHPKARLGSEYIMPGDKVIVSGPIASHGMSILSVRQGLEFEAPIKSDTAPVNGEVTELLDRFGSDIRFLRDPTRGGVATVLNELIVGRQWGINLEESRLPVLEPVSNLCEILGLDPLYVANEGIFVAIVNAASADDCVSVINEHNTSGAAAVIGEVVSDPRGAVILQSISGGRRVVHMPVGEQLPRIC
jgi:hydrogenase expression/formation protein HypE